MKEDMVDDDFEDEEFDDSPEWDELGLDDD